MSRGPGAFQRRVLGVLSLEAHSAAWIAWHVLKRRPLHARRPGFDAYELNGERARIEGFGAFDNGVMSRALRSLERMGLVMSEPIEVDIGMRGYQEWCQGWRLVESDKRKSEPRTYTYATQSEIRPGSLAAHDEAVKLSACRTMVRLEPRRAVSEARSKKRKTGRPKAWHAHAQQLDAFSGAKTGRGRQDFRLGVIAQSILHHHWRPAFAWFWHLPPMSYDAVNAHVMSGSAEWRNGVLVELGRIENVYNLLVVARVVAGLPLKTTAREAAGLIRKLRTTGGDQDALDRLVFDVIARDGVVEPEVGGSDAEEPPTDGATETEAIEDIQQANEVGSENNHERTRKRSVR